MKRYHLFCFLLFSFLVSTQAQAEDNKFSKNSLPQKLDENNVFDALGQMKQLLLFQYMQENTANLTPEQKAEFNKVADQYMKGATNGQDVSDALKNLGPILQQMNSQKK